MPIPVWVPGQVLTASDINQWLAPNAAVKSSDQSVTSSTVLVNDTGLALSVAANASYIFQCYLDYEGGTQNASDLKWVWNLPAGATMHYTAIHASNTGVLVATVTNSGSTTIIAGTNGAGVLLAANMFGALTIGATAGTIVLNWAQNTSNATSTIIHAQSFLTLQRTS